MNDRNSPLGRIGLMLCYRVFGGCTTVTVALAISVVGSYARVAFTITFGGLGMLVGAA